MAGNGKKTSNSMSCHHSRSASMPPDKWNAKVVLQMMEQQLNKLQQQEASSTSPLETLRIGFSGVAALYKLCTAHDVILFQQPIMQGISQQLLPICSSSKALLLKFRQGIVNLHLLLGSSSSSSEAIVYTYLSLRKQTARSARELASCLSHLESTFLSSYTATTTTNNNTKQELFMFNPNPILIDDDQMTIKVLPCVSIINFSVLDSLLHLLALPLSNPNKSFFKLPLLSKLRVRVPNTINAPASIDVPEMGNELSNVDVALHSLFSSKSAHTHSRLIGARQRLDALQVALEAIDDELASVASQLNLIRSSLVNNLLSF